MRVGLSTVRTGALTEVGAPPTVAESLVRHRPALLRYARSLLWGTGIDPDDAVQDVHERVLAAAARGNEAAGQLPYLVRAMRNRCIDLRLDRVHPPADPGDLEALAGGVDPADQVVAREAIEEILADVAALPAAQRDVFLDRAVGALAHAELTDDRRSASAVKSLVFRARRSLVLLRAARDTPCHEIRAALDVSRQRGVRRSEIVRRHLARCPACQAAASREKLRRGASAILGPILTWLGSLGSGGAKSALVLGAIAAGGLTAEAPMPHPHAREPARAATDQRHVRSVPTPPSRSTSRVRPAPMPPPRSRPAKRERPPAREPTRRSQAAVDTEALRRRDLARPAMAAALRRATTPEQRRHMTPRARQLAAYRELHDERSRRRAATRSQPVRTPTPTPAKPPAPPITQPAPEPAPPTDPAPVAEPVSSEPEPAAEPVPDEPAPSPPPTSADPGPGAPVP